MAIRPFFGSGGDSGFALGPLDNLFGSTSGDATATPSTVLPAANKVAAMAIRDAYGVATPSWLSDYDADSGLNIRLIYLDNGNTIIVHQIRQGGVWADNGSIAGLPGSGTDFSHVSDNHIPAIGSDKLPYDSGLTVNAITKDLRTESSLTVGSNSINLDDAQTISSGIENVFFRNTFKDEVYSPAWQLSNLDSSGRATNRKWNGDEQVDVVKQSINTYTLSDPVTFNYTVSGDIRIVDFQLDLVDVTTDLTIAVTTPTDEKVWKYNFGVATIGINKFSLIDVTSPTDIKGGDVYKFIISGSRLKGNASGEPWFTETFRPWNDVALARMEDLGGDHTRIKSFSIKGQSNKIDEHTSLSGNKTFEYVVELPDGVVGTGVLKQDGAILKSNISPTEYKFDQIVNAVTFNPGESVTWTLEFNLKDEGGLITKSFIISATTPEELMYWDVQDSANADDFYPFSSTAKHSGMSPSDKITIQTFVGSKYFAIAQPKTESDITKLMIGGINQFGAFTKVDSSVTINSEGYDVWISNNLLLGSVISGIEVEVIR